VCRRRTCPRRAWLVLLNTKTPGRNIFHQVYYAPQVLSSRCDHDLVDLQSRTACSNFLDLGIKATLAPRRSVG